MKNYDLIIIGTGGGTKISSSALKLGKKIALIEKSKAGGTCLNRGCIPSKMFIHPSNLLQNIKTLDRLKIKTNIENIEFSELVSMINNHTDSSSANIDAHYENADNADYFKGHGKFISDYVIEVNGEKLTAPKIIIAAGSRPSIPNIKGLAHTPFMTSNEALRNKKIPKRLIVLGGGYIATELGGAYSGYGSEVTFILRSTFLKREDPEIVEIFDKEFSKDKKIYKHTDVLSVNYEDQEFEVKIVNSQGQEEFLKADALLVTTGVMPNSDKLGLENTKIKIKKDGFIEVNKFLETSVKGVFAIGDVAGNYLFRHSVNFEAEYWVENNLLSETPNPIDYPPVPSAVFTHPEIASVGLNETEAKTKNIDFVIGRASYKSIAMAKARGLDMGLVKLLFEKNNHKLIGAHIIGDEASTMIQELVLAISNDLRAEDIYRQIYIHPAFPEVVRNAVRNALKELDAKYQILF